MKFKNIKKIHEGDFITRYDIEYETRSGAPQIYEMISRDPDISALDDIIDSKTDAVVMIMHDKTGEKILINREFRMAAGRYIYNFPAGLIDGTEAPEEAAARELYEETGLKLTRIDEIWGESYSAVGFSNEKNILVVGTAEGEIRPSDSEAEEIDARWYTKAETAKLLTEEYFAARTQAYCMLWCR